MAGVLQRNTSCMVISLYPASKPQIGARCFLGRATKLRAEIILPVPSKIGLVVKRTVYFTQLAAIKITEVRQLLTCCLPPSRGALGTVTSPDVNILHFPAFATSFVFQWIQIYECSSDIVPVVNSVGWKITSDSPVARLRFYNPHSTPSDSVSLPVRVALFLRSSRWKRTLCESFTSPLQALGHD